MSGGWRDREKKSAKTFCLPAFDIKLLNRKRLLSVHFQLCKHVDVLNEPQAECPASGLLLGKQINTKAH